MADARRNVVFIIPTLHGGGSERVMVNLLRRLDRARLCITVAVVDMRGAVYRDDIPGDVELIDLHCSRVRYALPRIIRLIWKRRPDVVFTTLGHLNLALSLVHPLLPGNVRYIARESNIVSESLRPYPLNRLWRWAYRRFYGRFDTVVCQSQDMRNDLVHNFAVPTGRIVVIPNPVDIAGIRGQAAVRVDTGIIHSSGSDGPFIHIVAAGRLTHQKGFDLLIGAIALRADPRLRLTLLGEGPMRGELQRMAVEKGIELQIRFVGFQKNPYPFFAQADVFVLSSRYEGFPNVVLEALACGTPVVATPAPGGVEEILRGIDGCVIADGMGSAELAEALSKIEPGRRLPDSVVAPYEARLITRQYEQVLSFDGP